MILAYLVKTEINKEKALANKSKYINKGKIVFNYYPSNRKTYFKNESRYVTQQEALELIHEANGEFEVNGTKMAAFLYGLLTNIDQGKEEVGLMLRAAKAGGLFAYIKELES